MYFLWIVAAALALDRVTKYWVMLTMDLQESIPVIQDIFHLTYIRNFGAAFSILQGRQLLLLIVTGVVLLGILVFLIMKRGELHSCLVWALSLIVAGGMGNFIDRAWLGYVPDFFDFRIWPIFNVADVSVCCGAGLLLIYVIVVEPRSRRATEYRR